MSRLEIKRCRECKKEIRVATFIPHPEQRMTTGCSATRWNGDTDQEEFVGWICYGCAEARVGEGLPGMISGPELEFHY